MDFACPSCKSDSIQRLAAVYESGLSNINTKSRATGIGIARDGLGVGVGGSKTTGTSQTVASQRAAPPAKKRYLKPLLLIFGGFVILSLFMGGKNAFITSTVNIIYLLTSVGWIFHAFQYNANVWPPLKATWDNSFLCNRCNEMFALDLSSNGRNGRNGKRE